MLETEYPSPVSNDYGSPPEGYEKECEALCQGKTIQELRRIADYFNSQASAASNIAETKIKYEDFEKAKKDTSMEIPTE